MARDINQKVKGTRDFYPEQLAFRNWLFGKMQEVSERYGYQQFDGPEIERMELYTEKTSEEIVKQQAFTLKDRDDRMLALRPELTPTFARMVAQQVGALTLPVRWYAFGRCWRYEQPQKGRGREFFQWEVNILGPETPEADAEIIVMAAEFLRSIGLTSDEVVIRVSDRAFLEATLESLGLNKEKTLTAIRIIDRKEKISNEAFEAALADAGLNVDQIQGINGFLDAADYSGSEWLVRLFAALDVVPGVSEYVRFDPLIVRGFDYYTRTVFEAWDKTGGLRRSLFGGGRFDDLTATLGGERVPGVGMAPGDMPIEAVLRDLGKMPDTQPAVARVLVTQFDVEGGAEAQKLAAALRAKDIATELWVDPVVGFGKQLAYANKKGIQFVVIQGPDEREAGEVTVKNMQTGEQQRVPFDDVAELLTIDKKA